ncbi:helix-turn-helix transcriptional regulator [Actinomadura miaoliensis]|uniref:HTH cro/C1-type domain-containing protein n=1 Tax=Actinomadura miaoliensis TaxID=430685 RepID=A0ABP7V4D5_9ACTN
MNEQTNDRICPACRITRLSRYNPDPLCAPCIPQVRDSGMNPLWTWDSSPLRHALARGDMPAVLAIIRGATGLSQLEFGQLIGWSQSVVSKIERRRRDTFYDIREILRIADLLGMPRKALAPLILGDHNGILGTDDNPAPLGAGMDMSRREFHEMTAGLAAGTMLPAFSIPQRADMGHVRYLRACRLQVEAAFDTSGSVTVLDQARRHFTSARHLVDEADYTETVGRQLLAEGARLGEITGFMAYDRNDQPLARRLYAQSAEMAEHCGDPAVQAESYTDRAQQLTFAARETGRRGPAREALRLTARATSVAQYIPSPRLHALIALRQALAHAALGDELAFRQAIDTARRELSRGPHPTDPAWTDFVTPSEINSIEASGYQMLARVQGTGSDRALNLFQTVLADPTRTPRDKTTIRARVAVTLLQEGDVKEALNVGKAALPASSGVTSGLALNTLRPLRAAAADRPDAEDFRHHYDQALRASAA